MFKIIHISDLHRSALDPLSNDELISALLVDVDRQSSQSASGMQYDAAIISGDLIMGAQLDVEDYRADLQSQYDVAYEFLDEFAIRFLGGDRSRVIFVPGNHDIDWNTARSAMVEVERITDSIPKLLGVKESPFRWDWGDQKLYVIKDHARYAERLNFFRQFHDRFYDSPEVPVYSDGDFHFELFELCDEQIVVAAFNSCHHNDCFQDQGAISANAIAKAHIAIKDRKKPYALQMAVWHHSTEGPPGQSDYMDVERVRQMIGCGFRVGLHGHQHSSTVANRHSDLPDKTDMVVISAGSLCAGPEGLPVGKGRQYNIIEVSDKFDSCKITVQEMKGHNQFTPVNLGGGNFMEASWTPMKNIVGKDIDSQAQSIKSTITEAEIMAHSGKQEGAITLLMEHLTNLPDYGRMLLFEIAQHLGRWNDIMTVARPDVSPAELIQYVEAAIQLKEFENAETALNENAGPVGLGTPIAQELSRRIQAKRTIYNV